MILLTLLLIPTLIAFLGLVFGGKRVTLGEYLIQIVAQSLVIAAFYGMMLHVNTSDVEIWNGKVKDKQSVHVSCGHSYQCMCVTVSCGKDCETTICQTCYEHSYDVNWPLITTNDEHIYIDRVNRQGTEEPPRWTRAQIGDTTSIGHGYTNYIKAAPDSLFRKTGLVEKYQADIPKYPGNIYDYHYLNRTLTVGVQLNDLVQWNKDLMELNANIGRRSQANVILVFTHNKPEDYFYALEQSWIGGKKNDIVVVIDMNDEAKFNWVQVMAWTNSEMFKINLRDSLMSLNKLDRELILPVINAVVIKDYIRKPMKDFEYLTQSVTPTRNEYIGLTILGLLLSLGITWFVYNNDVEDIDKNNSYYRRYR